MDKDVASVIKQIFDQFGTILRYMAPGFVALVVLVGLGETLGEYGEKTTPAWILPAAAALLGIWIYALHICVLERILWLPMILVLLRHIPTSFMNRKQKRTSLFRLQFLLTQERWMRWADKNGETTVIQKALDKWGDLLSFQYCTAYLLLAIPTLLKRPFSPFVIDKYSVVFWAGLLTLLSVLVSDYRHTNREFWAMNKSKKKST